MGSSHLPCSVSTLRVAAGGFRASLHMGQNRLPFFAPHNIAVAINLEALTDKEDKGAGPRLGRRDRTREQQQPHIG